MVAFALRADGWYLRSDIIWSKPNPMPESVTDRPTKAHEYIFLLSKSAKYYYDAKACAEPTVNNLMSRYHNGDAPTTRNRRSVWHIATHPYKGAHFATFPPALIEPCILAGSAPGDTVLDPFLGSGTTLAVAKQHGRNGIGCELNPEYVALAQQRIDAVAIPLS
jgi:DNA modification methylase